MLASDDGCGETTSGWDDNDEINVEGDQYSVEMIDGRTLLGEDQLSKGHIASAKTAEDASNRGKNAKPRLIIQHFCTFCY